MTKIYYKQKDSEFRIRFSIAHELGHFSLHKEIFENINITNNEDWKKIVSSIPRDKWSALEYQANEFAGSLLVPGKELIKDIYATSNLDVEKYLEYLKIRGYDSTLEGYLIKNLAEIIHRKYEVTSQVIEIRIQREKLDLEEFLLGIK
jgi:Zn-dependent peptidase ImmA (M78 family)